MTDHTTPTVIGGRYETVRPIGRGGMGIVWLARDTVLGREVAAKQIGDFPGESAGETDRAMREARAAAALNHPNVVAIYDVVEHEGSPWLVMEYVAGPTLATAVRQRGPMAAKGAADLGAQLAGALAAAHEAGVVHRDIKPANVLIGGGLPKLGDFGIARSGSEDQLTQTGMVTGTPSYMAPEVAVGKEHTAAADVWALGATIYFAVEGQDAHPSRGNALATLQDVASRPPRRPERAGPLEPVLADMLARDPERRPTMREALRRLEGIAAGGADVAPTARMPAAAPGAGGGGTTPLPVGTPPAPRRRTRGAAPLILWVVVAAVVAALLAGLVAWALQRGGTDGEQPTGGSSTTAAAPSSPSSTAASTEPSSESSTESSSETAEETPSDSSTQEPPFTASEASAFVQEYFATVTSDTDAAWQMLAPARRNNRSGYDEFWSGIESARPSEISVDPAAGTVDVTLDLQPEDGPPVTEDHTYVLTRVDGELKLDSAD